MLKIGTKVRFTAQKHPFYDARTQECLMLDSPLELACDGLIGEVIGFPRECPRSLAIVCFGRYDLCMSHDRFEPIEEVAA